VREGKIRTFAITPEQLGIPRASRDSLSGGTKDENAAILRDLFSGAKGPKRDALLANAAAALAVGGKAGDLKQGVALAAQVIDSGAARRKLDEFVLASQRAASL
jgi:anthranilate phosphoribosyltransferase